MPDGQVLVDIYAKMLRIRRFEEALSDLFTQGGMHGTCHLCIGQEALCAAAAAALQPQDYTMGTHRGHGHALSRGVDERRLMAEFFGRADGVCGGMGGSMHIADVGHRFLGTNGIVAAGIPISAGAALALKRKHARDTIVACFFGDGAANEGVFYETLNMSLLWGLPVLFICENNGYAMSTRIEKSMAETRIEKKARGMGMHAMAVDGNDALKVYDVVAAAREHVLINGPMLIAARTYRISGHSKSDGNAYRTQAEIAAWERRCPIRRLGSYLLKKGFASRDALEQADKEAISAAQAAVDFARTSPCPSLQDAWSHVYAE